MTSTIKIWGHILALWEGKNPFSGHFGSFLELLRSCIVTTFDLKCLCLFFSSNGQYMTSKIKMLRNILALWIGHFDLSNVKNPFSVLSERCFGRCFGVRCYIKVVWPMFLALKVDILCVFSARKDLTNNNMSNFCRLRGSFWPFSRLKKPFSGLFLSRSRVERSWIGIVPGIVPGIWRQTI